MSLGWVVSNESFWEPLSTAVTHFKIRGSYGLVGSDETGLLAGAAHFCILIMSISMEAEYSLPVLMMEFIYLKKVRE